MTELEKAAREYCDSVKQATGRYSSPENAFQVGAQWQAKQSPWISVEERLPNDYKDKLIKLTDGSVRLAIYDSDDDGYFWSDNYADEGFSPEDVTHWCPIPE